jgi:ribonuclease D
LSPLAKARADAIAGELATVRASAPPRATAAPSPPPRAASMRAQRWAEALLAIAHVVADEAGVAPRLISTRADAEEFARAADEHGASSEAVAALPALASWRRSLLGEVWLGWLQGRLALVGDTTNPHGVRIASLATEAPARSRS